MLADLIDERVPPQKRQGKCLGEKERHMPEAAVMLAYAMYLLESVQGLTKVELHPDGEQGKRFKIKGWLSAKGFVLTEPKGTTSYCGKYVRGQQEIVVDSVPGKGDVVAKTEDVSVIAECKGGIVNTKHPGQASRLRRGLCEAVGMLMKRPKGGRQVAVVPNTRITSQIAQELAPRAKEAGIEIALVDEKDGVIEVAP